MSARPLIVCHRVGRPKCKCVRASKGDSTWTCNTPSNWRTYQFPFTFGAIRPGSRRALSGRAMCQSPMVGPDCSESLGSRLGTPYNTFRFATAASIVLLTGWASWRVCATRKTHIPALNRIVMLLALAGLVLSCARVFDPLGFDTVATHRVLIVVSDTVTAVIYSAVVIIAAFHVAILRVTSTNELFNAPVVRGAMLSCVVLLAFVETMSVLRAIEPHPGPWSAVLFIGLVTFLAFATVVANWHGWRVYRRSVVALRSLGVHGAAFRSLENKLRQLRLALLTLDIIALVTIPFQSWRIYTSIKNPRPSNELMGYSGVFISTAALCWLQVRAA